MKRLIPALIVLVLASPVASQGVKETLSRPGDEKPLDRDSLNPDVALDGDSHAVKIPAERLDTKPGALRSGPPASRAPAQPEAPARSERDTPVWASGPALTPEEIRAAVQAQEEAEAKARGQAPAPPASPAPAEKKKAAPQPADRR